MRQKGRAMKIRKTIPVIFTVDVELDDIKDNDKLSSVQIAEAAYEEALLTMPAERKSYVVLRDSNLVSPFEILNSGTPGEDFIEIEG
jgi:hypothetical protein